jgi:RNA polymerase sigma-70 factor (ECF subfamily)
VSAATVEGLERQELGEGAAADHELLRRAGLRDEAAVTALMRAHTCRIHRTVVRILGCDADADDVVQQVFLAAIAAARHFDGRSSVATWLTGIATHRALDMARARARRQRWSRVTELVGLGRSPSSPEAQLTALDAATAALAVLTPEQRVVFVLHEVEGHTFAEIREMTGAGISTLHARLKAARRRLDSIELEGTDTDG